MSINFRNLILFGAMALALILLYLLAPVLAEAVPGLAGPLDVYTGTVDGLRASVAELLRNLLGG